MEGSMQKKVHGQDSKESHELGPDPLLVNAAAAARAACTKRKETVASTQSRVRGSSNPIYNI